MRKTNLNIKRAKFFRQMVTSFLIGQIAIALLSFLGINQSKPVDEDECKEVMIIVDDVDYIYRRRGHSRCRINSNNVRYYFPSGIGKYSAKELSEIITVGGRLNIKYVVKYNLYGPYNSIVDARNETNEYINFDLYNDEQEQGLVGCIIVLAIMQSAFLSILFFLIIFNRDELKLFSRKRKRKLPRNNNPTKTE